MKKKVYQDYKEVPWYRRGGINSALLFGSLLFPPLIWFIVAMLITGDIYDNKSDEQGLIKSWPKGNKIVAWVLFLLPWVVGILILVQSDLTSFLLGHGNDREGRACSFSF